MFGFGQLRGAPRAKIIRGAPRAKIIRGAPRAKIIRGAPRAKIIRGAPRAKIFYEKRRLTTTDRSRILAAIRQQSFSRSTKIMASPNLQT